MIRWKRADPVGALRTAKQLAKHEGMLYVAIPHFINGPEKPILHAKYEGGSLIPLEHIDGSPVRYNYIWRLHDMNVDSNTSHNDNLVFTNYWHAWAYAHVCGELYKS